MIGAMVTRRWLRQSMRLSVLNTVARMIVVAVLAFGCGCARSDWIQSTLVTVDVTGRWLDTGGVLELTLQQQGSRVKGSMVWRGSFTTASGTVFGAIEGDVNGDVFRFKQTGGVDIGANGEMTVNGDEMTGNVRWAAGRRDVVLQRPN